MNNREITRTRLMFAYTMLGFVTVIGKLEELEGMEGHSFIYYLFALVCVLQFVMTVFGFGLKRES